MHSFISMQKKSVPGQCGGKLIRSVIKTMSDFTLPLQGKALFLVSGGPDSMALLLLLGRYGKNVISPELVTVIYFDHGWRSTEEINKEWFLIDDLCQKLQIPARKVILQPPHEYPEGVSLEAHARMLRKAELEKILQVESFSYIFKGHHANDLAETLLNRFLTGGLFYQNQPLTVVRENTVRPLLYTQKQDLIDFLNEERQEFSIDSTNESTQFLRARLRSELMPVLNKLYPGFVDAMIFYSRAQWDEKDVSNELLLQSIEEVVAPPLRRSQKEVITDFLKSEGEGGRQISLKDKWILVQPKQKLIRQIKDSVQLMDDSKKIWILFQKK